MPFCHSFAPAIALLRNNVQALCPDGQYPSREVSTLSSNIMQPTSARIDTFWPLFSLRDGQLRNTAPAYQVWRAYLLSLWPSVMEHFLLTYALF